MSIEIKTINNCKGNADLQHYLYILRKLLIPINFQFDNKYNDYFNIQLLLYQYHFINYFKSGVTATGLILITFSLFSQTYYGFGTLNMYEVEISNVSCPGECSVNLIGPSLCYSDGVTY